LKNSGDNLPKEDNMSVIFKAYKIRKSEYTNLPALLKRIGLAHSHDAIPDRYVVSRKTYKVFEKEMYRLARKQYPGISRRRIMAVIDMELFKIFPVRLDNGVEFGYIIVVTEV
jgi:hypothetical protein